MKTGLFFGSFNPVHSGHMILASYMADYTDLDKVWMVVSPHNPFKDKMSLLQDYHRLDLVRLAIGDHRKLKASDAEFKLPKPSYTIHTLQHFREQHPGEEFVLLMGRDTLGGFTGWKEYETILDNHDIYVYPRLRAAESPLESHKRVHFIDAPLLEISSSFIREGIKAKKDVRYMLPEKVWEAIEEKGFYK